MNSGLARVGPLPTLAVLAITAVLPSSLNATGSVTGHARFERIKGRPAMGYAELYESNLFLSPANSPPIGPSRRLGAPGGPNTYDGYFHIEGMPAGRYSILVDQPLFFICPKVVRGIEIQDGQTFALNPELPVDYSTYVVGDWTGPGSDWYQTFTAIGTSVRGVSFVLAGTSAPDASVSVLEDNGAADIRAWPVIAARRDYGISASADGWVRFRSGEVSLVPGSRYAIRLTALVGGSIQPYKRNKDANSYVGGQAYDGNGVPQNYDLNITVFADNDGTRITMNKRTEGLGALRDGNFAARWGQTFTATASSLAGVDVWAAGANNRWDIDFTWLIRKDGPAGPIVGPIKTTQAAYQAFGVGLHGVGYEIEQVPLVPGQVYFVELRAANPPLDSPGFNPFIMDDDSYDGGCGYIWNGTGWEQRPGDDVNMTSVEHAPASPVLRVSPTSLTRTLFLGGHLPPATLTVQNVGSGTTTYSTVQPQPWLTVSPIGGPLRTEPDLITVDFDAAGLSIGTHEAAIVITAPGAINSPVIVPVALNVITVPPDFDGDTDVDMEDFAHLQKCLSGSGVAYGAGCGDADLNHNGDVDEADVRILVNCLSGPNTRTFGNCTGQQ